MSLAPRFIRRSELRPEHMDKARVRADLFERFGAPPYTSEQFNSVAVTVLPDKDPVSKGEEKARRAFAKQLAEAREAEAVASAMYEQAERQYLESSGHLLAAEANVPGGPRNLMVTLSGQPVPVPQADRDNISAARAAEAATRDSWEEAGRQLHRARVALAKVERRIDDACRRVRLTS